ncbi:MAG: deiodinase family protein [Planctomycetaceae bacterium]|nr:deiodinase family protein [Planctomycetaceae bacterium]
MSTPSLGWLAALCCFLPVVAIAADGDLVKQLSLAPEQYADDAAAARTADELEKKFPDEPRPEAVRMLVDILRGSKMGPGEGWFGPAQSRFDWKWVLQEYELAESAEELPLAKFGGKEGLAKRLDRDGDGSITPDDLDWSDRNSWVRESYVVGRLFRRMNARGDGRLTRDELTAFFDRLSQGKDHLLISDLRDALLGSGGGSGDLPSREVLVRGLIAGEIGSIHEGPRLGDAAPDFTLNSPNGSQTHQLSKMIGKQPVVLVFGNFTCGPFRAFYPEVDALFERYRGQAAFLMVYVREAHPTDGWAMKANERAGVAFAQPKTLAERVAVCDQFCQRLRATLPVAVDDVGDEVGHAYSGMPARLYLIDAAGKVAYKSGRGPFGFKVGELEQALVMALIGTAQPPQP